MRIRFCSMHFRIKEFTNMLHTNANFFYERNQQTVAINLPMKIGLSMRFWVDWCLYYIMVLIYFVNNKLIWSDWDHHEFYFKFKISWTFGLLKFMGCVLYWFFFVTVKCKTIKYSLLPILKHLPIYHTRYMYAYNPSGDHSLKHKYWVVIKSNARSLTRRHRALPAWIMQPTFFVH